MKWLRRLPKWLWKLLEEYAPFGGALLTIIVGTVVFGTANLFIFFSPTMLTTQIIATLTIATFQYYQAKERRSNSILIELTVTYLVNGHSRLLDKLLGKLISGTWHRDEMKPGNALFQVLKDEITKGDFWKRRRIAEALPMLGAIDLKQTTLLMKILRDDWSERWKSDLRRRTVEALYNRINHHAELLINELPPKRAIELLKLRDGDQIYTAMAVFEAMAHWTKAKAAVREKFVNECVEFTNSTFSIEEKASVGWLKEILLDNRHKRSTSEVLKSLSEAFLGDNEFVQIAAARNIAMAAERNPAETLSLIARVASQKEENRRNVRRPLSKEKVVRFVMDQSVSGLNRDIARLILASLLLEDPEEIIRLTTFDEMEYLIEKNVDYARELCEKVASKEANPELRERALRALEDLDSGHIL